MSSHEELRKIAIGPQTQPRFSSFSNYLCSLGIFVDSTNEEVRINILIAVF